MFLVPCWRRIAVQVIVLSCFCGMIVLRTAPGQAQNAPTALSVAAMTTTATKLEAPKNHGGFFAFAFAPDGKSVAGGTGIVWFTLAGKKTTRGGEVVVWDAETGKLNATLGSHQEHVTWVRYSAEGKRLVSISDSNGLLKVWDVAAGKLLQTVSLGGALYAGAGTQPLLSADAGTLVSVDRVEKEITQGKTKGKVAEPNQLTVWDLATGKARRTASGETLSAMALSPDGKRLALSTSIGKYGDGGRSIAITDTLTGQMLHTIPLDLKQNQYAHLIAFLPDGEHLAGAGNHMIHVWNIREAKLKFKLSLGDDTSLSQLRFSSDGKSALSSVFMGERVQRWELTLGAERLQADLQLKPFERLWHPQFSADLSRIACQQANRPVILRLQQP